MTQLKDRLKRLISSAGPISVSEYMATCLFDPEAGYYTTREPFGAKGDFTTAPEISQMFGELIGVWLYSSWVASGKPAPFTLAEIGPGRGTLMADMLRTIDKIDPSFIALARIALIEASPRLTELQRAKLDSPGRAKPIWYRQISDLPDCPLFIVGNELFDAVPTRQFVKTDSGWRERMVALDNRDELVFAAGLTGIDASLLPQGEATEGAIFEIAPARSAIMDEISQRIASRGGAGLFIDYGHLEPGFADTLQAMKAHAYDDVFANPGEADLTSHVDFFALAACARAHGLKAQMATQGDFLLRLGLAERAGSLGRNATVEVQDRLRSEVERLAAPEAMGTLFKVIAVAPQGVSLPALE